MKPIPGRKYAIINGDDFGFSMGITRGILRAHREGILTSTTVTANMPDAEESVKLLADAPRLGVGVHLNVSQGPCLSSPGQALADETGQMNRTAGGVILAVVRSPRLLEAIEAEFDAQIRWALDHGIAVTHLDSHRHAHAFGPIFSRVVRLAKRYHIPLVRRHGERLPGPRRSWPRSAFKQWRIARLLNLLGSLNARKAPQMFGTLGTWGVEHTGQLDASLLVQMAQAMPAGVTEIMTHPGFVDDLDASASRLLQSRVIELEALCDASVKDAFANNKIELIHYGTLR